MRFAPVIALLFLSLCDAAEVAQQPTVEVTPDQAAQQRTDDKDADPRDNRQKKLTPEEELQRQIRMFDPLDRGNQGQNQDPNSPDQDRRIRNYEPVNPAGSNGPSAQDYSDSLLNPPTAPDEKPLPGSLAALREQQTAGTNGPEVSEDETPAGEYTGPAVLSRSYTVNSLAIPTDAKWTESLNFGEVWDSGATRPSIGANGVAQSAASTGTTIGWSFGGREVFKHDQFGFNYGGSMSRYASNGTYSGSNNTLSLKWTHIISRHLTLTNSTTGSLLATNSSLQSPAVPAGSTPADVNLALSPSVQSTVQATKQLSNQLSVMWQESARLSFTFGGGYFGIIREGAGLVGATGYQAQGSASYRYSRVTTFGLYYSFSSNLFPHGLGASDTNTGGLNYSRTIGRSIQVRLSAGLSKTESLAETPVPVAPIVAALLGTPVGIVDYYHATSSEDISAQIMKDFGRRGTVFVAYTKGITPGNGVLLTSTQESFSFGTTFKLLRFYTVAATASDTTLTSVSQALVQQLQSKGVMISVNRPWKRGFTMNTSVSYRYQGISNPQLEPNDIHVSTGITWSPPAGKVWPF